MIAAEGMYTGQFLYCGKKGNYYSIALEAIVMSPTWIPLLEFRAAGYNARLMWIDRYFTDQGELAQNGPCVYNGELHT